MKSIRARAPNASSEKVRFVMQRNVGHETGPEKILRGFLHKMGFCFRKDYSPISSLKLTADLVFPKQKVCIFIDGCFWHGCPIHFNTPKTNSGWWFEKIEDNRLRDERQTQELQRRGWLVLRYWEHDITLDNLSSICSEIDITIKSRK